MAKKPKTVPVAPAPEAKPTEAAPAPTPAAPTPEAPAQPAVPVETPPAPASPPAPKPPEPDYKTLYGESTREFQVLNERKKQVEGQLEKLTSDKPITDDEMRSLDEEWDLRTPFEQNLAKRQVFNERKTNRLELEREQERLEKANAVAFNAVVSTNPELQKRKAEFEQYVAMPTHQGVPMEVLVSAFLHDHTAAPAAPAPAPGPALQPGTGGPKDAPRPKVDDGTISAEEAKQLRLKDPKKWQEYARLGKIRY